MRKQISIGEEVQCDVSRCSVDYKEDIAVSLSGWGRHVSANVAAEYDGDEVAVRRPGGRVVVSVFCARRKSGVAGWGCLRGFEGGEELVGVVPFVGGSGVGSG